MSRDTIPDNRVNRNTLFLDEQLEFMIFYDINEECWVTLSIKNGSKEPMLSSQVREFVDSPVGETAIVFDHNDYHYPLSLFKTYKDEPERMMSMFNRLADEAKLKE